MPYRAVFFPSVNALLVLPNQYCPITIWKIEAGFFIILFCGLCLLLHVPYYEPEPLAWFLMKAFFFFFAL